MLFQFVPTLYPSLNVNPILKYFSLVERTLSKAMRSVSPRRVEVSGQRNKSAAVSIVSQILDAMNFAYQVEPFDSYQELTISVSKQNFGRARTSIIREAAKKNQTLIFRKNVGFLVKQTHSIAFFRHFQLKMGIVVHRTAGTFPTQFYVPVNFAIVVERHVETTKIAQNGFNAEIGAVRPKPVFKSNPHISSNLTTPEFPIDVVYTWVDGNDDNWLRKKLGALQDRPQEVNTQAATGDQRFRNRDELKYSLRSIDMFAPFVRNVYIVTDAQRPDWLSTTSNRVHIIDHAEIFASLEYLPCFNSNAIESHVHRIPGLSENFVYMNDDFFLARMCSPETFFSNRGYVNYFPSRQTIPTDQAPTEMPEYLAADRNAALLFSSRFSYAPNRLMMHAPYACKKSVLVDLEGLFNDAYRDCRKQPFRSRKDIRPIPFMFPHYAHLQGIAGPRKISHLHVPLSSPDLDGLLKNLCGFRRYDFFCLNDANGSNALDEKKVDTMLEEFLEQYFPLKSEFER